MKLSLLFAEDNRVSRHLIVRLLRQDGHKVTAVKNGEDAYKRYLDQLFDVVLMDIQMPNLNGVTTAVLIREYERKTGGRYTPIIAVTGHLSWEDRELYTMQGFDGYVPKPVVRETLYSTISTLLETHQKPGVLANFNPVGDGEVWT